MFRKELAASKSLNRSSAAGVLRGESNSESHVRRECGGPVTIPKKLPRQASPPRSTNKKLTKLLINVNIQRSFGPVHIIISIENTVGDLIKAAIEVYLKEKRRPLLTHSDARCYDLHYSQFSLPEEKLTNLESRNFFLCPKPNNINSNTTSAASKTSCSNEANTTVADTHAEDLQFPCTRFMDFLL
ncbi:hypothetical protein DCAR_0100817 [Daucus carota subsp. sativus]|uniref:DUF7054 domain-containing protein n=1 Tax=Daucus carota subsp. sativus TaxID=79200 RepID=A0AAF0W226_DAUCS|nr:hypothetical protein DCAR_0100817 [Daucus carota subsp. sativus]